MGTIDENRRHWTHYDWAERGDEWSVAWGGTSGLWWVTLWPRLRHFLPTSHVLEIAPGFGRITELVAPQTERMTVVDVTELCVEHCRERFRRWPHVDCRVNDGRSLPFVAASSIDFAFSFDSLVHVELDVIGAYLGELARVLRPGGAAFLHHSNLADARAAAGAEVPNPHWRAESVGAEAVASAARGVGLDCVTQERLCWGGDVLNDCFSTFVRRAPAGPTERREHREFMREPALASELAAAYRAVEDWPFRRSPAPARRIWPTWLRK